MGERSLRRAVDEFCAHYHEERNHQGLENELIEANFSAGESGELKCRGRLGGLLRYYHRKPHEKQSSSFWILRHVHFPADRFPRSSRAGFIFQAGWHGPCGWLLLFHLRAPLSLSIHHIECTGYVTPLISTEMCVFRFTITAPEFSSNTLESPTSI